MRPMSEGHVVIPDLACHGVGSAQNMDLGMNATQGGCQFEVYLSERGLFVLAIDPLRATKKRNERRE